MEILLGRPVARQRIDELAREVHLPDAVALTQIGDVQIVRAPDLMKDAGGTSLRAAYSPGTCSGEWLD